MHISPWRGARILACAAALALVPPLALPAFAAPAPMLDQTKKTFIVQMTSDPIASYEGGVAGIAATAPEQGAKVNATSANARKYQAHLRAEQRRALREGRVQESAQKHEFTVAFNGFTAVLTDSQAAQLGRAKGVAHVWEDEIRYADTVTTPEYLGLAGRRGVWQQEHGGDAKAGRGIVVGVIDSGIDPGNPSFAALPRTVKRPAGFVCDTGDDPAFACSSKIVGARYYGAQYGSDISRDHNSPRDTNGHGSHTASTAAGNHGVPMNLQGADVGLGSGMAPAAQVAVYKVLWQTADGRSSGTTSAVVAAIDDAVRDGVDVINYSISGSRTSVVGADEIAFMGAANAGVFVATSAGNDGDSGPSTVAHNSPWTTTVAASTHDRGVENTLTLGNGATYQGVGFGGPLDQTPLVRAADIPAAGSTAAAADLCGTGTVDDARAAGKLVVCTRGTHVLVDKAAEVKASGGAGMVLVNVVGGATNLSASAYGLPAIQLSAEDGVAVKAYAASASATAAISATRTVTVEAPDMASFSSFGPALAGGGDLVKPDITAPGVDVIAAYSQDPATGQPRFNSLQGTSMSAPHIAGLGALLKQKYPKWSPMAIKSAMMTTARQSTNEGDPIMRGTRLANPLDYGAGEVVPTGMYEPGLVYDSSLVDWLTYACGIGQWQQVVGDAGCATLPPKDPSDFNSPSIGIGELAGTQTVTRTVTNPGKAAMRFRAHVEAPAGTTVKVTPETLTLLGGRSATFEMTITRTDAPIGEYTFGALTWVPDHPNWNEVRSPIAVKPVAVASPVEVDGSGTSGSAAIPVTPGFTGTLTTDVDGLLASTVNDVTVTRAPDTIADGFLGFSVAPGTKVLRVATFGDEVAAEDIDLYLYRQVGTQLVQVSLSGSEGSSEEVTLRDPEPGSYIAVINLYSPEPGVVVPLNVWNLTDAAAGNLTATPTPVQVTLGRPLTVTAAWTGLAPGQRYLGQLNFSLADQVGARTLVTVTS